jgi:hypothetical protein
MQGASICFGILQYLYIFLKTVIAASKHAEVVTYVFLSVLYKSQGWKSKFSQGS